MTHTTELNNGNHSRNGVLLSTDTPFDPFDVGTAPPIHEVATIWLNSLTATPGSVHPFEAATIEWDVHAEGGPLRIELNGELVGLSGSRVVTPQSSSVYRIVAKTPRMARELGQVSVGVDSRACVTYQPVNVLNVLDRAWEHGLQEMDTFSLTRTPTVTFTDGRIHLRADVRFDLDRLPATGTAKIRASFRIGVSDRQVVSADEDINVEITLPLGLRWIPQAAAKVGPARIQATQGVRAAIDALVSLIGFLGAASPGMALVSARIITHESGAEVVSLTQCPDEPLGRLVGPGKAVHATIQPRILTGKIEGTSGA